MIRIALVEDDPAYAEQLLSYLKEYEKESKERISVQTFSDGEDIVTEYRADYDIQRRGFFYSRTESRRRAAGGRH